MMTNWKVALFVSSSAALAAACSSRPADAPPLRLTSARLSTSLQETEAEHELAAGQVGRALATSSTDESLAPGDPWAHYDRAVALDRIGRAGEAAAEYRAAESAFAGRDAWGKAITLYGRAHALASNGRCVEARSAYEEYAAFVGRIDPHEARMAQAYEGDCVTPAPAAPAGWVDYDRAIALADLHRTDEAVASFRKAEGEFRGDQLRERSLAVYGRARALADARRCPEAKAAYGAYAALVGASHPRDAQMAESYARDCSAATPSPASPTH